MPTFGSALWGGGATAQQLQSGVPIKNLFYMALRLAHVTKAAQIGASPEQLADCLQACQLMISQAQVKKAMIFSISIDDYVLGTGPVYTLGKGGTLVSTTGTSIRPVKIERAKLILQTGTPVYLEVFSGSYNEFANLAVQQIPGALPKLLYCDYDTPLANVYLVPQDQGGDKLELYTWQAVPSPLTINDLLNYPPGYDDWLVNNLAVRLASIFDERGAFVTDDTRLEARKSEAAIRSRNTQSPRVSSDVPSTRRRGGGSFNYYDGMDK
jgi:hypothetical protein